GAVVGDAPARAAHRERGPEDDGEAELFDDAVGFVERARDAGLGALEADAIHRRLEELALLGLTDRVDLRADELDAVLLERAPAIELEGEVQGRLPAERRQERVRPLARDHRLEGFGDERLDV